MERKKVPHCSPSVGNWYNSPTETSGQHFQNNSFVYKSNLGATWKWTGIIRSFYRTGLLWLPPKSSFYYCFVVHWTPPVGIPAAGECHAWLVLYVLHTLCFCGSRDTVLCSVQISVNVWFFSLHVWTELLVWVFTLFFFFYLPHLCSVLCGENIYIISNKPVFSPTFPFGGHWGGGQESTEG